ncbi:MAG: hypothetical protein HYT87_09845 [Nitrospirae bacterium]|nr:hypothetical protein [Nitrospirota bacterium]
MVRHAHHERALSAGQTETPLALSASGGLSKGVHSIPRSALSGLIAVGVLLLPACGSEETVTECRTELHVSSAKLICPAFSVVYDFQRSRTSIADRSGRVVVRNATATYQVLDPNTFEERRLTNYDVSDAEPFEGARLGPKERHGTNVKFPSPLTETESDFGKQVFMMVTAGGGLGGFEQRFVGFSRKDFLLIYTSFSSGVKCPAKLLRLSPLEVDGAKQPWSSESERSGLFVAGRPEDTSVDWPEPSYQIIRDLRSDRMLLTGVLRSAFEVAARQVPGEPAECSIAGQAPPTTFTEPERIEKLALRDRGRTGYGRWSVEQKFDGVIMDTSAGLYPMAVLYLDLGRRPREEAEADFLFYREHFRPDGLPGEFPFAFAEPE